MKKMVILVSILALSASVAFTQEIVVNPPIPETQGSVRKMGSAYVFGRETDAISAGSIYDLSRSFFSLGHTPSSAMYPMAVFDVGLAINPLTYFGIAGGFNINETTTKTTTTRITKKPSFFSTIALGVNKKFGFHYNIAHATVKTVTPIENPTKDLTGSVWLHQFSFAMRISPNLKYTIPVGVVIEDNSSIDTTTRMDISKIIMFLNPNFTMYPESGVTTQFKAGVEVDFSIYNKTITDEINHTDTQDTLFRLYATPTFAWSFLDNQFRFMVEPTFAFLMHIDSKGKPENSTLPITTTYSMTPSISAPVGIAFKPVEWFEFRSGLLYNLGCTILNTHKTGSDNKSEHTFNSAVMVFAGFGFIIANDFLIDLAFQGAPNSISMSTLSLQLTYNF